MHIKFRILWQCILRPGVYKKLTDMFNINKLSLINATSTVYHLKGSHQSNLSFSSRELISANEKAELLWRL